MTSVVISMTYNGSVTGNLWNMAEIASSDSDSSGDTNPSNDIFITGYHYTGNESNDEDDHDGDSILALSPNSSFIDLRIQKTPHG